VYDDGSNTSALTISGWVLDPSASGSSGVDGVDVFLGQGVNHGIQLAGAQLGLRRTDVPSLIDNPDWATAGFSISLPLSDVPVGPTQLTLAAHTPDNGTWLSSLQVMAPSLGPVPALQPVAQTSTVLAPTPMPRLRAEIASPRPGDQVAHSFVMEVLAPNADRIDVFLEPDRNLGGRLVGSTSLSRAQPAGAPLRVTVNAPLGGQTLYVHVSSTSLAQEQILTVPVVIRS